MLKLGISVAVNDLIYIFKASLVDILAIEMMSYTTRVAVLSLGTWAIGGYSWEVKWEKSKLVYKFCRSYITAPFEHWMELLLNLLDQKMEVSMILCI